MATLSTAMVGPMDGIGFLNVSRVMKSCRFDGIVLKPDRPQKTVETCFRSGQSRSPEKCYVFETISALKGIPNPIHYFFDNDPDLTGGLIPDMLRLTETEVGAGKYVVFNWYSGNVETWEESERPLIISPGNEGHVYAIVSPVLNWGLPTGGIAFLGEYQSKYVPCSSIRFPRVDLLPGVSRLAVVVAGVANETVEVCVATEAAGWSVSCENASFDEDGTKVVRLP